MATLRANVYVGDDQSGQWYGPAWGNADQVPKEALEGITNPNVWLEPEVPEVMVGAVAPREERDDGLDDLSRDELFDLAEKRGVEVRSTARKGEIIDALRKG